METWPLHPAMEYDLPEDLTAWVSAAELMCLTFLLAHDEDTRHRHRSSSARAKNGCPHWLLLGSVTYGYATGLYGSDQIAASIGREEVLRENWQGELPDGQAIRSFREKNRMAIQHLLVRVLEAVVARARDNDKAALDESRPALRTERGSGVKNHVWRWLGYEAAERLCRAEREDRSKT